MIEYYQREHFGPIECCYFCNIPVMLQHRFPQPSNLEITMPKRGESKQDAFIRLANARIPRVLEEMRLVGQLTNRSYAHDEAQAEEIIATLAKAVEEVSNVFRVPFSVAVGDDAQYAEQSNHLVKTKQKTGEMDVMAIAMAIEEIEARRYDSAKAILKRALLGH